MSKNKRKKHKAKRILCILLTVISVISLLVPIAAYAATGREELEIELLQEGDFSLPSSQSENTGNSIQRTSTAFDNEAQEFLYNKMMECSDSFSLYSYKIKKDDFRDIYCDVINDNPDLFYVSSSVNYSYYKTSGYIAYVYPEYTLSADKIESAKLIFNQGVEKALSVVDDTMTDLQKALVIHDYVCDLATYPDDAIENDKSDYHSAYGFFYNRRVVCAGYALAYSHLMHQLGIECEYIASTAEARMECS